MLSPLAVRYTIHEFIHDVTLTYTLCDIDLLTLDVEYNFGSRYIMQGLCQ